MPIKFYRERDQPYGCFSNFSRHRFEVDGMPWQTVEHYFQAMKFAGTPHEARRSAWPLRRWIAKNTGQ